MDFGGFFRERRFYESPAAIKAYRLLRKAASKVGFQVVLKTFYSPIPELERLPADWFDRAVEMPGVDLRLDAQLQRLREELAAPMSEFAPPRTSADPHTYAVANPSYSALDAAALYATIRALRPRQVVELGSGHSTLVTAQAVRDGGLDTTLHAYDPYAAVVRQDLPGLAALHSVPAQEVPLSVFEALGDGDVLFVDTTHTVKAGSDVNFLVLQVLPRLAPGVVVHLHDIFIPFEYPRVWLEDFGLYWAEQYLVQAFLAMNPAFEVLWSSAALARLRGPEFAAALPAGVPANDGSAFWIRRRTTSHDSARSVLTTPAQ
jgi:predicted O-methyltransferase YrrM